MFFETILFFVTVIVFALFMEALIEYFIWYPVVWLACLFHLTINPFEIPFKDEMLVPLGTILNVFVTLPL